ncbi:MAG: alanine racemase [Stagnimonas sp.]|nr:alanine racemase [Stagnimonas sp.]
MTPRVTATVDLAAIRHNLKVVRKTAPRSKVMAAVKADAYGHGAVEVARALEAGQVDALAVACMEEALQLREAHLLTTPIALLEGVISIEEAALAVYERLQVVVHDHWQIALLEQLPASAEVQVWFKLDSGMHRLGFPLSDVPRLVDTLKRRPGWKLQGWITHLACADELDSDATPRQIGAYETALLGVSGPRSIANSAGLLAWPEARVDWVRPGLMLYGASPLSGKTGLDLGLVPALRLESRLIAIREYAAGEPIGYGQAWRTPERMPIGVVAVGYADGVHRCLPSGTPVMVAGTRVPLVGRVSMDMITVDLRGAPAARVGDSVLLWGPGLPAEEVAGYAGTIAYELFCGLTQRVRFRYRG